MSDSVANREKAKSFSEQVKSLLGDEVDWEGDSPPSIQFVARKGSKPKMKLEYLPSDDRFILYDKREKTGGKPDIGSYSPSSSTPAEVVQAIRTYIG